MVAARTGRSAAEVRALAKDLCRRLRWVEGVRLCARLAEARAALGAVDPDDVPYFAAALAIGAQAIWSHDRHFEDLVPRVDQP
jgi:predicted nucleic acid-binding protein